ncbi:Hypothetical protein FKW44_005316 [Caligus rogercresseyi]|uniref:Uncharacterized protein n=1 Tax=Caligus rogercresseyi TaxID=217165 RepID=A0A7T8QRX0_CALRO|nr:Hypothetical protein FKW44_005316 [Caligus rogercresseyi]
METCSLTSLTPALASPPSRDGTLSSIRVFCPGEARPGRPRETRKEENVARVKRLVEDNPRMTTRKVAYVGRFSF